MKIGLVDDHSMFRYGLATILKTNNCDIVLEADNGQDMIQKLQLLSASQKPNIIFLDLSMPVMNGFQAAAWLKENEPEIKVIALSMRDDEKSIIQMIKLGARAYLTKDANASELLETLTSVYDGYPKFSGEITEILIRNMQNGDHNTTNYNNEYSLSDKELLFIQLACSELTYKEIADKMNLSVRTIDLYRMALFEKFDVKSRTGLVLHALKNGLVTI